MTCFENKIRNFYLLLLSIFFIESSAILALKEDADQKSIYPEYDFNLKFQVTEFLNFTSIKEFDRFESILPQLILERIRKNTRIHKDQLGRLVIKNSDKILKLHRENQENQEKAILSDIEDIKTNTQNFLEKMAKKKTPEEKIYTLKSMKTIRKLQDDFYEYEKEEEEVQTYLELSKKQRRGFRNILGFDYENSRENNHFFSLEFESKLMKLDYRDNFNLNRLIKIFKKKENEVVLLGRFKAIKKMENSNKNFLLQLHIFDNYTKKFLFKEELAFASKDLDLDLDQFLDKIIKKLEEEFFQKAIKKGKLKIKTKPEGANIYLNERKVGKSNLDIAYPIGTYELKILKQNFKSLKRRIFILEDELTELDLSLGLLEDIKVNLKIESDPQEADVYLDLDYLGTTPLFLNDFTLGQYKLRLEKKGYQSAYYNLFLKEQDRQDRFQLYRFFLTEGKTEFEDYKLIPMPFNILRNSFFYFSFVALGSMVFSFVEEKKYYDRLLIMGENSAGYFFPYEDRYNKAQYKNSMSVRNTMLGITTFSMLFTLMFFFIELNLDDQEMGFKEKNKDFKLTGRQEFFLDGRR